MKKNIILIGAGIMSATLATILKELSPEMKITVFEKLPSAAEESSNEWNNAGTGHAALCELNYTSEKPDGTIDINKAIAVNEQFQLSKQFWSYLIENGLLHNPKEFIQKIPHMSFVSGSENVSFLKKRFEALKNHPLFEGMEYSENHDELLSWIPLMMNNRPIDEKVAATKMDSGTDVNFGNLTRMMFHHLESIGVEIKYNHHVESIDRLENGLWELKVKNNDNDSTEQSTADFVFIGAGGGSLPLLQKTKIPESRAIGGFPVSGLFMVCHNPDVTENHHAKVYGRAKLGAPPMSVPHLDSRFIDGKKTLLFGPFAGFSPKFLKNGSYFDLISSVNTGNLVTMLSAGAKNIPLTKYLIEQVMLSKEDRLKELSEFIPNAKIEDWDIVIAGQRVQVIKDTPKEKGVLQFGTEVITSSDGSVAALLGASPGASTAVYVMLDVIKRCFPDRVEEWKDKIKEMIPSYGLKLSEHPELFHELDKSNSQLLGL